MNLRALTIFVAVAESGGLSGAASRLGRTASTISTALKELEQEIGAPLFEGDRKSRLKEHQVLPCIAQKEFIREHARKSQVLQEV